MPYKDPEKRRQWDRTHRPDKLKRIGEAARWADGEIAVLRSCSVTHSKSEWKALRTALISAYLKGGNYREVEAPIAGSPPDPVE